MHVDAALTVDHLPQLLKEEGPKLLAYFARRVENHADAADLAAECFVVAVRRSHELPSDVMEARLWLYGVARNTLRNHRRGRRREAALYDALRQQVAVHIAAHESSDYADLHRAIAQLHTVDQEIVQLVHWEGFSLAEVAQLLRRRPGSVRSRYARARERLRATLTAEGP